MKLFLPFLIVILSFFSTQVWAEDSIASSKPEVSKKQVKLPKVLTKDSIASQEKTIPGGSLAAISYIILWFMLLAYFVVLTTRLSNLKEGIKDLDQRIDDLFKQDS